jgi:hypothetical protein
MHACRKWPKRRSCHALAGSCSAQMRTKQTGLPQLIRQYALAQRSSGVWAPETQAFLVSQKISAISSILASSASAAVASMVPLVPPAPASLVA